MKYLPEMIEKSDSFQTNEMNQSKIYQVHRIQSPFLIFAYSVTKMSNIKRENPSTYLNARLNNLQRPLQNA